MQAEGAALKYPMTWEANLLVTSLPIVAVIGALVAGGLGYSLLMLIPELLIGVPGIAWVLLRRYSLRETLRLNRIDGRTAAWSAAIGLVCWPVVAGMAALIEMGLSRIGPGPQMPYPTTAFEGVACAFVVIVLAPIIEEPIFRGFVMSAWLRRGTLAGLVLSGFLFASVHLEIAAILPITLLGIVFGLLVQRSNSLYSSILAHMSYNAVGSAFILAPALRAVPVQVLATAGGLALPLAIVLLGLFVGQFPAQPNAAPAERSGRVGVVLTLLVAVLMLAVFVFGELYLRLNPAAV